jgi:Domain of unknown function (DUF4173)
MVYFLLLISAILTDAAIIHTGGHLPGIGIFIAELSYIGFIIFALKKEWKKINGRFLVWVFLTLLLSSWFAIFTNPFFHICFLILLFLGNLFLIALVFDQKYLFFQRVSSDMRFLLYILHSFFRDLSVSKKILWKVTEKNHLIQHHFSTFIKAIISLILLLFIILPLLFSADHIFAELAGKFFSFFFSFSDIWTIITRALTVLLFFVIGLTLYESLKMSHFIDSKIQIPHLQIDKLYNYIVLGWLNCIYVIFVFVQMKYTLFVDEDTFHTLGMSYGEYIHSWFYQLVVIALLNYIIYLYFHKKTMKEGDIGIQSNLYLLLFTTIIITYSAFSRILLYISAYDLTMLRVFVVYIIVLIFILFLLTLLDLYKQNQIYETIFYRIWILSFIFLWFFNIDKYIAEYNFSKWWQSLDRWYIMGLSYDAIEIKERILSEQKSNNESQSTNLELPVVTSWVWEISQYRDPVEFNPWTIPEIKKPSPFHYNYYQEKAYEIGLRYHQ